MRYIHIWIQKRIKKEDNDKDSEVIALAQRPMTYKVFDSIFGSKVTFSFSLADGTQVPNGFPRMKASNIMCLIQKNQQLQYLPSHNHLNRPGGPKAFPWRVASAE